MKKLISYLAALAMTVSIIPANLASAEAITVQQGTDGVVTLDDADANYNAGYLSANSARAFGGTVLYADRNAAVQPQIDWTFNMTETSGNYDIWVLETNAAANRQGHVSSFTYSLNGGNYILPESTTTTFGRYSFFHAAYGYPDTLSYFKIGSEVELGLGDNTLSYKLNTRPGQTDYLNAIDRILIVPSSFQWVPNSVTVDDTEAYLNETPEDMSSKPAEVFKPDSTGSIIMEAEKGEIDDADIKTSSKAFGGAYVAKFAHGAEKDKYDPYISWDAEIPDDREYDIWALTLCNPTPGSSASEMNTMQMYYDETDAVNVAKENVSYIRYPATEIGLNDQKLCWTKVYSKEKLGKGTKYFVYKLGKVGANNLCALDRVVIAPSENLWRPSSKDYTDSTEYLTDDIPCIMDTPFKPDDNNVIWMEAEEAEMERFSVRKNENASGGKDIIMGIQGGVSNDATYNVDFLFDVSKAESYDIWVLAANTPEKTWYSHYETSLDGEEYKKYVNGFTYSGYDISDFPTLYELSVGLGGDLSTKWVKANVSEALSEGRHKFSMQFPQRQMGDGYYIAQVDAVAVVPSRLNWVPDSINKPQKRENGYAWIEAESPDNGTDFQKVWATTTNNSDFYKDASNSAYLRADNDGDKKIYGNQRLDYSFTLANSGTYDIYFLGSDVKADYLSKLYYDIDSAADSVADEAHKAVPSWKSTTVMRALENSPTAQDYWQKIGSAVEISAGEHTLNTEWAERSGTAPTGKVYEGHYMEADAFVIIPTDWGFVMPDETAVKAIITAMNMDETEKSEALIKAYADGVRSDLVGLDTYGSAGCAFTYDSRSDNITNDGVVTRPEIGADPVEADFEIFAHKIPSATSSTGYKYNINEDTSFVITLNVMPMESVVFSDFAAAYADGSAIAKNALVSGGTVNASVSIKKADDAERSAIIAAAVYKNGVLVSVESNSAVLSDEMQILGTSITLPAAEDMSGYSVKVFLWDSLANANPYTNALEY